MSAMKRNRPTRNMKSLKDSYKRNKLPSLTDLSRDNLNAEISNLNTAVSRLENISKELQACKIRGDELDQFGKYLTSLLRGLPERTVQSLQKKIVNEVFVVKGVQGNAVLLNQNPRKRFMANIQIDPSDFEEPKRRHKGSVEDSTLPLSGFCSSNPSLTQEWTVRSDVNPSRVESFPDTNTQCEDCTFNIDLEPGPGMSECKREVDYRDYSDTYSQQDPGLTGDGSVANLPPSTSYSPSLDLCHNPARIPLFEEYYEKIKEEGKGPEEVLVQYNQDTVNEGRNESEEEKDPLELQVEFDEGIVNEKRNVFGEVPDVFSMESNEEVFTRNNEVAQFKDIRDGEEEGSCEFENLVITEDFVQEQNKCIEKGKGKMCNENGEFKDNRVSEEDWELEEEGFPENKNNQDVQNVHSKKYKYNDEEKEVIKIASGTKHPTGKRWRSKTHCCKFCQKLVIGIGRHILSIHKEELEVAHILSLNKEDRKIYLEQIEREGDYNYNKEVLATGKGELILVRRPTATEILKMLLINAHNLYNVYRTGMLAEKKVSLYDFRLSVLEVMLPKAPEPPPPLPLRGTRHTLSKLELRPDGAKRKNKSCRICTKEGRRKSTMYVCRACPEDPGLCPGKCFDTYHKNL